MVNSIIGGELHKKITFNNVNDIWEYILLLKQESEKLRKKGSEFTDLNNIYEQLPFFCCYDNILDEKYQKDIAKYIYCSETNTPPYLGSYGDIPILWIEKYFIIKSTINIRNKKIAEKNNA